MAHAINSALYEYLDGLEEKEAPENNCTLVTT